MASEKFKPESLHGISFFDDSTKRNMRYIYPDAGHWTAGWLLVQNESGEWMTLREATTQDIHSISAAIVREHHDGQ